MKLADKISAILKHLRQEIERKQLAAMMSRKYVQKAIGSNVVVIDADELNIHFMTIGNASIYEWLLPLHLIAKASTHEESFETTLQMLGKIEDIIADGTLGGNAIDVAIVRLQFQTLPEWERDVLTCTLRIRFEVTY